MRVTIYVSLASSNVTYKSVGYFQKGMFFTSKRSQREKEVGRKPWSLHSLHHNFQIPSYKFIVILQDYSLCLWVEVYGPLIVPAIVWQCAMLIDLIVAKMVELHRMNLNYNLMKAWRYSVSCVWAFTMVPMAAPKWNIVAKLVLGGYCVLVENTY